MPAQAAAHHKHHARTVHKKIPAVPPKPVAARKPAAPARSLAIISKAPNDAPDFDFQDRIEEAQALVARQPVLKDDMQFDADGNLAHFVWTLAVGQKTGPLTVVRMDEAGNNDQGFTVTWRSTTSSTPISRSPNPTAISSLPSVARCGGKDGYEEGVYTAYAPELDTKTDAHCGDGLSQSPAAPGL